MAGTVLFVCGPEQALGYSRARSHSLQILLADLYSLSVQYQKMFVAW